MPHEGKLLRVPLRTDLAKKHGKTPAQIVRRWHIQPGLVVIPKSAHPEPIKEHRNSLDFALSQEEMAAISARDPGVRVGADPDTANFAYRRGQVVICSSQRKNATPTRIALAWLLAQQPWIVPIPGTRRTSYGHQTRWLTAFRQRAG